MTAVGLDRPVQFPFGRERAVAIGFAALAMALMVIPELGYVPLWDGRIYANCVMDAAYSGMTMESLRCAGHPSQGWATVLAIPQLLAPGSVAAMHLTNLALGIIAIIAIRVVFARAFPAREHARALDLAAIACAVNPVVMSTLLQPNVDFGVYVFFFVALAGLLSPGRGGTAAALIGGTLLVFSKETGVAAYGLAAAVALAIEHVRDGRPLGERVSQVIGRGAVLSLPVAVFIFHVSWWNTTHPVDAIWKHGWQQTAADGFKFFDLTDPVFLSYAAGLFVLGFMWVAWVPVAVDGVAGLARMAKRKPTRAVPGADVPTLVALTVMTALLTYVLTSFRTWSNLRYFALLYPLFVLLTYASLVRLGTSAAFRRTALGALVVLWVVASYRSVDPLSRVVYGTFDAGQRRMYRMTSITDEFEGPGRDQLVYNLEFTGYHHVQNELYRRIVPTDSTVIGTTRLMRWNIWSQLDPVNHERTMRRVQVVTPVYADEVDIAVRRSREAWFLDFSNRGDSERALAALLENYAMTDSLTVFSRGQKLTARHLVRRGTPVLP